ncbi:MAG: hypothetical protein V7731_19170 [Amphritea sp.]
MAVQRMPREEQLLQGAMDGGAATVQGRTVAPRSHGWRCSEYPGMNCMLQCAMDGGAANVQG